MAPLVGDAAGCADVLVARATPAGTGALAIVRLSGPAGATLDVARRLAPRLPESPEPRRAHLTPLHDAGGEPVDEGLALFFAAPASATGEEVVELHAHGSPAVVEALVAAAVAHGARRASPGEFTRRALANGKVDLARAEGIGRLAAAASRGEARGALGLVRGELSRRVERLREEILDALVELEARLDFSEELDGAGPGETRALGRLSSAREGARALAGEVGAGRPGEDPPSVVIVGAPNAGKSTLFNALVGEDRALVTEVPGTTRDAVSEVVEIGGERVRLVDTAGLRETGERVERLGVEAARRAASAADLLLVAREPGASAAGEELLPGGIPRLEVATKTDLGSAADGLRVSARSGEGLGPLRDEIARRLAGVFETGAFRALPRQREALVRAAAALDGVGPGTPAELAAAGARGALHALGEITGETATEELLDRVFSTFCVGK